MFGRSLLAIVIFLLGAYSAEAAEWSHYSGSGVGIDLPTGSFEVVGRSVGRLRLADEARAAQLEVFSGRNVQELSIAEFRREVATADPNRTMVYEASGRTWFVVSGYMPDPESGEELIYYAKFIFDPAGDKFAAFEISYPRRLKASFDWTITRLEKSLSL
ncbi:hypothetical protein [Devosia sp. CN2-171]|uniref:hypothetical protein n=1 Tax=Devosia sp. CN2-171 TaxID=3400909 RepID=UPI003BF85625